MWCWTLGSKSTRKFRIFNCLSDIPKPWSASHKYTTESSHVTSCSVECLARSDGNYPNYPPSCLFVPLTCLNTDRQWGNQIRYNPKYWSCPCIGGHQYRGKIINTNISSERLSKVNPWSFWHYYSSCPETPILSRGQLNGNWKKRSLLL